MRYAGFIGPSYTQDSKNIDSQNCVNWYPKLNEMGTGKEGEVGALIDTPGLNLILNFGTAKNRGQYKASNGQFFVCNGNKLYKVDSSFNQAEIGELLTSTGHVSMKDNGTTLFIADGPNGYTHTLNSSTISKVTDVDWRGSNIVEYIDGYFMFADPDTGVFYIAENNSTNFDTLDFSTADGAPDNIVSLLINYRQVWLFGSDSIETWYNSGNVDFPFERTGGGFIEIGCAAPFSVAKMNNSVFWIGQSKEGQGIVYQANGLSPQRISTHAVELAIQSYGDISDAVAYTYQENGHFFYVLNFTSANTSWIYDLASGLWHERAYWKNGAYQRHRANYHSFVFNKHIVSDYNNGKVYEMSHDFKTDAGDEIRRMRTGPHISNGLTRLFHHSFQLDMETGVGLDGNQQGDDPKVILQFSDDGGHTWSNEKEESIGKIGQKSKRVLFRRLGQSRDRIYRVIVSDPVKAVLTGAEINLSKGAT